MELLHLDKVSSKREIPSEVKRPVVEKVSFVVAQGEFVFLIGPSGGGKSTLLRMLNRLDEMGSGEVFVAGEPLNGIPPARLRRDVSLLSQRPVMFPGSVIDNVLLPFRLIEARVSSEAVARACTVLTSCGIPEELQHRIASELSIGQQQRVALARALVLEPKILLGDEPTSALDRPTALLVAQTLKSYSRDSRHAVLMVSHDLELAARFADRLVFLVEGKIIEQGRTSELLTNPRSEGLKAFLDNPDQEGTAEND